MTQPINKKKAAADKAVEYVKDGMYVGLGTGSTAYWAIHAISRLVREGMKIKAIATSMESDLLARELGIEMVTFADADHLDITIDGADEANENLDLIKGGGGALVREKIVADASEFYIIIADDRKLVSTLGSFPLPVEVVPFGWEMTRMRLKNLGCSTVLRSAGSEPFISDNANYIIDCSFGAIEQPAMLHQQLNLMPGVVDNGLFVNMADVVIFGREDGSTQILERAGMM